MYRQGYNLLSLLSLALASPQVKSIVERADSCATPTTQHLSAPPYENYFYSDCNAANQVVVTSPLSSSNLTLIGPRLLVAWPAGDSGVVSYFSPKNGVNGSLAIELVGDQPLSPIYTPANSSSLTGEPVVGISTPIHFNSSAILDLAIMGSIRTIRDFTEGPSLLHPEIQDAVNFSSISNGGASLARLWLDNKTIVTMSFVPEAGSAAVNISNRTLELGAGTYQFNASFDYPQLTQLSASEVLNPESQDLIQQQAGKTTSLSFLSYRHKLLAGAWRFLTYFGRDSMITLLLMQPVFSEGPDGAIEAVIGSVLERLNKTDGKVCHEETIGDYATYENQLNNISSNAPSCTYIMVDSDYYLQPVMQNYFLDTATGRSRREAFFSQKATLDFGNAGLKYGDLAVRNAEKVMRSAKAFAQPGGQKIHNLVHLVKGQIVGDWRDSTYGIGGGRQPYDVNTALVPAALRAISQLSAAGFYPQHSNWSAEAAAYAQIWEDNTLQFFEVTRSVSEAKSLVTNYTNTVGAGFPSHVDDIESDVVFHGLSLNGYDNLSVVEVMNSDDCFRHYLLNTTNQTQLTAFVNQTANNVRLPFPVGLSTDVGMLIANPAYGGEPVYAANWTHNAYQGTVVWGWPLAMMAAGLQRQLYRCNSSDVPDFCNDSSVYNNVITAYNQLWDVIDANKQYLSNEVWSWQYRDNSFQFVQLGDLPPPPGSSYTESDIRQLWSLSFLAVTRDESLK